MNGNGNGYSVSGALVMPANDITVHAQWVANQYKVVYNANGGTGAPTEQVEATDVTVTVSATTPSRTGYTFTGWDTLPNGGGTGYNPGNTFNMPANNTTLYAQWQINRYSLIYDANGGSGSVPTTQTDDFQASVIIDDPTLLTNQGYTFTGWNTAANGGGTSYAPGFSFVIPAANTTLFAQWFANTNAIIYDVTGGTGGPADDFVATNATATVSATVPTKTGYTFVEWQTGSGTPYDPSDTFTMPGYSVVLYAVWTINSYTLTYDANGGTGAPTGGTHVFDTTVTVSASTPTRGGFNFASWNTAQNGSGTAYAGSATFNMPAENVTLYAQWTAIPAPPAAPNTDDGEDTGKKPGPGRNLPDPDTKETRPETPVTIDPITTEPPADDDWDTETMRIVDPVTEEEQTEVVTPDGTWELDTDTGYVNFTPAPGFFGRAEVEFVITTRKGVTYRAMLSVYVAKLGPTIPVTGTESSTPLVWAMWMIVAGILLGTFSRRRRLF